jgi:hypothetical protein
LAGFFIKFDKNINKSKTDGNRLETDQYQSLTYFHWFSAEIQNTTQCRLRHRSVWADPGSFSSVDLRCFDQMVVGGRAKDPWTHKSYAKGQKPMFPTDISASIDLITASKEHPSP